MKNVLNSAMCGNGRWTSMRNKMSGWAAMVVCLLLLLGVNPAMAQDECANSSFTINEVEKLEVSADVVTTIVLPFKGAKNVATYKIRAITEGLTLASATGNVTLSGEKGTITFTAATSGKSLPAGNYCFNIEMTSADGCLSDEKVFTVSVKGKPVLVLDAHNPICSAMDANNVSVAGTITGAGTLKYTWTAEITTAGLSEDEKAKVTGYAGSTAEVEGADVTIAQKVSNATTKPVVITYTVTPVAVYAASGKAKEVSVTGESKTVDVTVYPALDLTVPADAAVCSGTTLEIALASALTGGTNTVSWTSAVAGEKATISGNTDQVTTTFPAKITDKLTNTGMAAGTVTYTVTQSFESCTLAKNIVMTVNPTPAVQLTVPIAVICDKTEGGVTIATKHVGVIFDISVSTNANITGQAGATGVEAGEWKTGTLTLAAGIVAPQALTYTVTPKIGTCTGEPQTYIVTVNPTPTVTLTNAVTEICNTTSGTVDISSNVTGVTYEITTTGNSNITITGEIGALAGNRWTTPVLTNNTGNFQVINYAITATMGTCPSTAVSYAVTVVPTITLAQPDAPAAICSADPVTTVTFTSPDLNEAVIAKVTYDWEFTYDDAKLGVSAGEGITISGSGENMKASGTGAFPQINITNKSDEVQTVTVSVKATYKNGTLSCSDSGTETFVVTINPKPTFELGE